MGSMAIVRQKKLWWYVTPINIETPWHVKGIQEKLQETLVQQVQNDPESADFFVGILRAA